MRALPNSLSYRRSRFGTNLPVDRLYTADHYWLLQDEPGLWRVGLTAFGTRQRGDLVECAFAVAPGVPVSLGQEIGSIEGLKALTSICSVVEGEFLGGGDDVLSDSTIVEMDPYDQGWLYRVRGRPDPAAVDVHRYVSILDAAIDQWLRGQRDSSGRGHEG